ncbi:MAG: HAD-IIIA family hydrolase [Candidatus Marinimicrobia bacterium]|nr:HAD-IIIA family hydrolase [Candidatus Neomarinimicrobiota bacterium]
MNITTVFLDRDGVLNIDRSDYLLSMDDIKIQRGVAAALKKLSDAGLRVIVVSNQAGIGKELISRRRAEQIFDEIIRRSEIKGGHVDGYYYCPHTPDDGCNCRKPEIGLFLRAKREHNIIMEEAVFVGDGFGDAGAAKRLKIPFYLVEQGWGPVTKVKCDKAGVPYIQIKNLRDAVDKILALKES